MRRDDLTPHDRQRIAVEAHVDPRTVAKFISGQSVRPSGRARIEDAMRRLGYSNPGVADQA